LLFEPGFDLDGFSAGVALAAFEHQNGEVCPIEVEELLFVFEVLLEEGAELRDELIADEPAVFLIDFAHAVRADEQACKPDRLGAAFAQFSGQNDLAEHQIVGQRGESARAGQTHPFFVLFFEMSNAGLQLSDGLFIGICRHCFSPGLSCDRAQQEGLFDTHPKSTIY